MLFCITTTILIGYIYIRLKFQFWSLQPVFHLYDIKHWIYTDRIINQDPPCINKYINFKNIETYNTTQLSTTLQKETAIFILNNYLRSKTVNYSPSEDDIFSYLSSNVGKSFVSIYRDRTIREQSILGVITARPLFVSFSGKSPLLVNYIDNLTVRKNARKQGIAPQLIQTHHYNIRNMEKNVNICLFKREGDMTAIVPLTTYNTIGYAISDIRNTTIVIDNYHTLEKINAKNFMYFKNIVKEAMYKYDCTINMDILTVTELVLKSKLIIYVLLDKTHPICCYILRNSLCTVEETIHCMDLIGSINMSASDTLFLNGLKKICKRIETKHNIGRILIESTGDSHRLIQELSKHNIKQQMKCPTAFFLYNYAHYSIPPEKCFFLY